MFIAVGGGSFGFQIGASFTDSVMLFMNDHALHSLLGDKFKIGGDVTVAAGPVGRQASANTDARLDAEILSYSRSKGLFAGISLDGAVVQADHSGDRSMYGHDVTHEEILGGRMAVPASAHRGSIRPTMPCSRCRGHERQLHCQRLGGLNPSPLGDGFSERAAD